MNCIDFQQRFHRQLDRRDRSIDVAMQQHMRCCDRCRGQVQLWGMIEQTVQAPAASEPKAWTRFVAGSLKPAFALAVAASVLLMATRDFEAPVQSLVADQDRASVIDESFTKGLEPAGLVDWQAALATQPAIVPELLWNDLRRRDWLAETMPTVHYVRDGVAPLGRSIKRAATLLTTAPEQDEVREQAT